MHKKQALPKNYEAAPFVCFINEMHRAAGLSTLFV
jgi:hypothetical protein